MCGRFTLTVDPADLQEIVPGLVITDRYSPRYNIAPTQPVAVIVNDPQPKLYYFIWGLIPSWSKDPQIGSQLINARAETLTEKPAYRNAFRQRRCLIPADGFYEWRTIPGERIKTPYYVHMKDGQPFAFAGLWEIWRKLEGSEVRSCTIVTTEPNDLIRPIHNRMPVILSPEHYATWLNPQYANLENLRSLLIPYPHDTLEAYPVSRLVNSPENDKPECIRPVSEN